MTEPVEGGPDPLLSLYQREMETHTSTLNEGLTLLAIDSDHTELLPGLERAAQQIRAASLIVNQPQAATLARAIESTISLARRDPFTLHTDRVNDLLAGVELLRQTGEAAIDPDKIMPESGRIEALIQALGVSPEIRSSGSSRPSDPGPQPAPVPPPPPPVEPKAAAPAAPKANEGMVPPPPPPAWEDSWIQVEPPPPPPPPPVRAAEPAPASYSHNPGPGESGAGSVDTGGGHVETLLELFREEVHSLTDTLSNGLVELEANADPRTIEPLMRAAHSIKGAARIVGCEPGVDIAHVMEELLVAGQRGVRTLTSEDIDPLLASVDVLAKMANTDLRVWASKYKSQIDACVHALNQRMKGQPASPIPRLDAADTPTVVEAPPTPAEVVPPLPPPTKAPSNPSPGGNPIADPGFGPSLPSPILVGKKFEPQSPSPPVPTSPSRSDPAASQPPPSGESEERVVRISAVSLTRLLSLAGESLVEARWLQPFARSLVRLKKFQDHLADVLEDMHQVLTDTASSERITTIAEDARQRLADCRRILAERIDEFESHARQSDDLNSRLYREVIASRMRPFSDGTHGLARMVRDVARQLGKSVKFEVLGKDTDVDRDILDRLEAPLGHMLRNALDHGLEMPDVRRATGKNETGTLRLEARHHAGMLDISVSDDGRGIDVERVRRKVVERKLTSPDMASRLSDAEVLEFLFLPGFSTADSITDISGRGVGLDTVQAMAQAVGGSVRISTKIGQGTRFEMLLPITLSVVRAVLVRVSGDPFALPLNRTDRLLKLPHSQVRALEGKPHFEADDRHIGLVPAHMIFELPPEDKTAKGGHIEDLSVVLIGDRSHQYGLVIDGFLGEQDLVVRPLDPRLGKVPNVSAAALLDDGSPVLIVDVDDVLRSAAQLVQDGKLRASRPKEPLVRPKKRVLVVDDSAIVREAERQMLQSRGYEVDMAVDGVDGWNAVRGGNYALVVSDIDMPRMTGLELVRAIRGDMKVQSTPVVIVSYKDREDDKARGLEAGANYYLTKSSFHDGRFLQAIEDLIGGPEDP